MIFKILHHLLTHYNESYIKEFRKYISDNSDKIEKKVSHAVNCSEPSSFQAELDIILYAILEFIKESENYD